MYTTLLGALSAAATLVLALATVRLARQGRSQLVGQSRPVLVVGEPQGGVSGGFPGVSANRGELVITVENIGHGPALNVGAVLPRDEVGGPLRRAEPLEKQIAVGRFGVFTWTDQPAAEGHSQGWIEYTDVGENGYRTTFLIEVPPVTGSLVVGRVVTQWLSEIPPFVPAWMGRFPRRLRRVYVQRKLRPVLDDPAHPRGG